MSNDILPKQTAANGGVITMSSREIAELLERWHDDVKRSIKRLVDRGVISEPPMAGVKYTNARGADRTETVYQLCKRDSYVVVAQLSPEFTARLVDRWQELEAQAQAAPAIDVRNLGQLQNIAMQLIEVNQEQAAQIEDMREDVKAHERLVKADGTICITDAAKNLGIRPKDLFQWLNSNGWIYKRPGCAYWLGYQTRCNAGDLDHKTTTVLRADGTEKITEQVRVTAQGLSKLAKLIKPVVQEVA
ncbi:MAG: phage antirepressor KilAC domain-containing protein [Pseudomonadota bacterium]